MKSIKSLAMLKMEKNFIAYIEKNKSRYPYEKYGLEFWLDLIYTEWRELRTGLRNRDFTNMKEELADISNIVDIMFERVLKVESDNET